MRDQLFDLLSINPLQNHLYLWVSGSLVFYCIGIKAKIANKDWVTFRQVIEVKDEDKTKKQFINELVELRQRIAELEALKAEQIHHALSHSH